MTDLDRLTREELHEIVTAVAEARDRARQHFSSEDIMSGRARDERLMAIGDLHQALDRYGL